MAQFVIKSGKYGIKTFVIPDEGGTIRIVEHNNRAIGKKGEFSNPPLKCMPDELEKIARSWWKSYTYRHVNS